MFFKDWQVESLRYLWSIQPEGAPSRAVWESVNKSIQCSISRASIINYLNDMVDEGLVTYTEETGKGGHHRVYRIAFNETDFKAHIAGHMISKLLKEYPKETKKALQLI
ncbi:MAG: hypothetical protein ACTSQY_04120 [Candidatus Odinarchaeia archaeon]